MSEIIYRRGTEEEYDEYMELLNLSFEFFKPEDKFEVLLPKLYKPELNSAYNAFIAFEDGKMRAAVGHFPIDYDVAGETLHTIGIGNVCCHPDFRNRGFMGGTLKASLQDMIDNNIDYAFLSGDRLRYNNYSYEICESRHNFNVSRRSLSLSVGMHESNITVEKFDRNENEILDYIEALYNTLPYKAKRDRKILYDILTSWQESPRIIKRLNKKIGYCIVSGDSIKEIVLEDTEDLIDFIAAYMTQNDYDRLHFSIHEFRYDYISILENVCSHSDLGFGEMYTVINYERVIRALLKLKATYSKIDDFRFTVLIHGYAGDEKLVISSDSGKITVEKTDEEPEITLDHLEAVRFFFANTSSKRIRARSAIKSVLPLPIASYSADCV